MTIADWHLIVPDGTWRGLSHVLHPDGGEEQLALAFARTVRGRGGRGLLVEAIATIPPGAYASASAHGLRLSEPASAMLNDSVLRAGLSGLLPVHLHSHPAGVPDFSATDDAQERALSRWLSPRGCPAFASVVWPRGGPPRARLWRDGEAATLAVWRGLHPVEAQEPTAAAALDRQRAFGPALGRAAADLSVGIVGLGGVGLPVAEQLARSGFRRFVLVDPDTVEHSNLNRMPGTTPRDVGRPKVQVARRTIMRAARCIGARPSVEAFARDVHPARGALRRALSRCDLLLALTDDNLGRLEVLGMALEAGAEYLQAGVAIELAAGGGIAALRAEVAGAETGRHCPVCSGRLDPAAASVEARRHAGPIVAAHAVAAGYLPDVPTPAVMSLNAIAAGSLVLEIQRRVAGLGMRDFWQVDLASGTIRQETRIEDRLAGHCAVCGRGDGGIRLPDPQRYRDPAYPVASGARCDATGSSSSV